MFRLLLCKIISQGSFWVWRYVTVPVPSSLIDWVHTQNNPCIGCSLSQNLCTRICCALFHCVYINILSGWAWLVDLFIHLLIIYWLMVTSSTGHQMKPFSALQALCAGNSPVTAQRPVTQSFDIFFDLRLNKWLINQSWGCWFETSSCSLWRHSNVTDWFTHLRQSYFTGVGVIIWFVQSLRDDLDWYSRDHSRYGFSQWEKALHSNPH